MKSKQDKEKKQPKPKLISVVVREISTKTIVIAFPPNRDGEKRAERYRGLYDLEIIKEYDYGGQKYESN